MKDNDRFTWKEGDFEILEEGDGVEKDIFDDEEDVRSLVPPTLYLPYCHVHRAFCPTGPGGGVDNSCSPKGGEEGMKEIIDAAKKEQTPKTFKGSGSGDDGLNEPGAKKFSFAEKTFRVGANHKHVDASRVFHDVGLTNTEIGQIKDYSGSGYGDLNTALRGGGPRLIEEYRHQAETLDRAIAKSTTKASLVVQRKFDDVFPEINPDTGALSYSKGTRFTDNYRAGTVFEDKGFVSTSTHKKGTLSGDIHMKIKVPKGSKALWIGGHYDLSSHSNESEVILPRGSKFKITKIAPRNKYNIIHVEAKLIRNK